MSHRNRFASALDRPVAVYVPEIAPPKELHNSRSNSWSQSTSHDLLHLQVESNISSREKWVALAWSTYIELEPSMSSDDIYNLLLDRVVPESFTLHPERILETPGEMQRKVIEAISVVTTVPASIKHIREWNRKYAEIFHIVYPQQAEDNRYEALSIAEKGGADVVV